MNSAAQAKTRVLALAADEDRLAFGDRELYWLPSGGMMDADVDLKAETGFGQLSHEADTHSFVDLIFPDLYAADRV